VFEKLRKALVPLLRLPLEPTAPFGAPNSVRTFRAGRNFYKLRLVVWLVGQAATLIGIVVSLGFLTQIKNEADIIRAERRATAVAATSPAGDSTDNAAEATPQPSKVKVTKKRMRQVFWSDPHNPVGKLVDHQPWWLFPLIAGIEFFGIVIYVVQLPVTYAVVRLEFESHWYIVTDRSLRIRSGIFRIQESTMSFANVQQVTVTQGPLQRFLCIADVRVQSAGGGGKEHGKPEDHSMHTGVFHSVDNAHEIRDLVLERLRNFRAAGLGDPDDFRDVASEQKETAAGSNDDVSAAARELLDATRSLRAARRSSNT
jgi:membrane protein YdbS with pleckstrin-like domain